MVVGDCQEGIEDIEAALDALCEDAGLDADCGAWAAAAVVEAYELGVRAGRLSACADPVNESDCERSVRI